MRHWKAISVLALAVLMTGACGASRQAGWDRQQDRQEGNLTEVLSEAEAAWEGRGDAETLRKAISLYEKAIAINPDQLDVLIRLARAYYFLSDGYHRGDRDAQLKYYDLAASWGEKAMAQDADFVTKVKDEGADIEDAVEVLDAEYAGAVYWSASAVGKWARLKGFTTLLSQKNKVKKFMEWVTATDPDYYHAGPPRYWGAYYAIAPSFAGGDVEKPKEQFEKSLEMEPDFFGTKVLMADAYATKVQDRELFERLLTEVLEGDPTVLPEVVPEQKVEQEKARELLGDADDLFASVGPSSVLAGLRR